MLGQVSSKSSQHTPAPLPPSRLRGLCTFQEERRKERREGPGAGAKAPRAAPLTLSEDGRLRWARWRLPCRKAMQRVEGGRVAQTRGQGRKKTKPDMRAEWRERESAHSE